MKFSPQQKACLPRINKQNLPPPDPVILRSWVKSKLSVAPSTYVNYEEGMKAIKEQIQQDFSPQYHSLVMQVFYQEFYRIEIGSGEAGDKLWARWRTNHRKELETYRRSSSTYGTMGMGDPIADSQYPEMSSLQDRRAALDIPTGASRSIDATKERQIKTSLLISEAEGKLLQSRDSNYWENLAVPDLPQTAGKAKIVYISPKSAKNTVNIENQQLSDPNINVRPLSSHTPDESFKRNSLPTHIPQIDDSNAGENAKNISILETYLKTQRIESTINAQHSSTTAGDVENITPFPPIQRPHGGNFPLSSTPIFTNPTKSPNGDSGKSFQGNVTPPNVASERGGRVHPDFTEYGNAERNRSHPEKPLPDILVTRNLGCITKRREGMGIEVINPPRSKGGHQSPGSCTNLSTRSVNNALGIHLEGCGVPVHEVHQGHGMLGIRSPVVSFVASPSTESPVSEDRSYQTEQPQAAKKSLHLASTPPYPQACSSLQPHKFPESSHSSNLRDYNDYPGVGEGAENPRTYSQPSAKKHYDHLLDNSSRKYLSLRDDGVIFINTEVYRLPVAPEALHTRESLWDGELTLPPQQYQRSQSDQLPSNKAQVTWDSSFEIPPTEDIEETNSHLDVPPKIRSRFPFVPLYKHHRSRTATHNTRKRSSLQPNGLRVTKEVLREEEDHSTFSPNGSTFATHVAICRKDSIGEIQKVHTKADIKKPTFLRVIQDAVHDRINIRTRASSKAITTDVNTLRTPRQYGGISKLTISGPMHDGNPLKISSSPPTPNVLLNATPILGVPQTGSPLLQDTTKYNIAQQRLPATAVLDPYRQKKLQTELMPWELNNTPMINDESLPEADHEGFTGIHAMTQVGNPAPESTNQPAITIDPFQQASLYSWIECSVVQACSDFLRQQQDNLNLDLLRKEVKKWKNSQLKLSTGEAKLRDQPIEFMFGMEVQCKLLEGNHRTLHFSGPSAMNAIAVINSWKHIIPSFNPRTFCFPDYLILEHLRVIEKVLCLFGPAYWDSAMFEKKRAEIVKRIMEAGQSRKAWSEAEKISKLQRDRERAEASLLQAVGIWSTEYSQTVVALEGIEDAEGGC